VLTEKKMFATHSDFGVKTKTPGPQAVAEQKKTDNAASNPPKSFI
jgi:hypothetical protein